MSAPVTIVRGRIGPGNMPGTTVFEVSARRTASSPTLTARYTATNDRLRRAYCPLDVRRIIMKALAEELQRELAREMP